MFADGEGRRIAAGVLKPRRVDAVLENRNKRSYLRCAVDNCYGIGIR